MTSKAETVAQRIRNRRPPGEHGSPSPLGIAIGACLRSGDRLLRQAAIDRINEALDGRTRAEAAAALGVSPRALYRWLRQLAQ